MSQKLAVVGPPPLYDEELRLWLENHIKEHPHLTPLVLARKDYIGMSRTAIDDYLKGIYFLPVKDGGKGVKESKLETLIRAYRERVDGTARHGFTNTFVNTRAWQQFQHACTTAINESVIVVVYSKPGVGKSRCLNEFSVQKMTTAAVTVLCSANITVRYFVQKLARSLGLDDRPPTAKLEDNVAEKLKRNPRPLFIDQANYLNERSLGTICYIWEIARVPIVLIGTKDLYELFTTSRLTEDVRAQLSSRVAMHYPLVELAVPEAKGIIQRALGTVATDQVCAQIINATSGIHRHVDMILPRILELMEKYKEKLARGEVTIESLINHAASRLVTG
ncbi:MAG TPA: AAA family ATPase [Nitrososphaera sp.]|nr:AAA family ATPase [Nitrososphaera sp.]